MRHFGTPEERVDAERRVKYRGTACNRLEVLQFSEETEADRENVERLKEILRKDCDRFPSKNHIPAIIEQSELDDVLQYSDVSVEALERGPPPELKFPAEYRLRCLHGRDRIQAGLEVLTWLDAWWTVDLYISDANQELTTVLIEEYSNEKKPSDGEIYQT